MATATWNVSKDGVAASGGVGAGQDIHLPVGYMTWLPGWSRAFLGFSYSFSGMVSITAATLYLKTSSYYHATGNGTPTLYIDRVTGTWSEGSYGASEAWDSRNSLNGSAMPAVTSAERVSWGPGVAANTWYSANITAIVQAAFAAGVFNGIRIMSIAEANVNENHEFWSSEYGSTHDAYITVTYTTNTAPNAPTGLAPTADALVNNLTPTFTGNFSDPDAGDLMAQAQVIVYADDGTTQIWDSGAFAATGSGFSKIYAGSSLAGNTFYKWKGRTADDDGAWGAYSALQRFKVNSVPSAPSTSLTESPSWDITTLTPTFNVTHNDPDASDSQLYGYQIVLETSDGTAVWDSGQVSVTPTVTKQLTYAGPALSWQTGYRWKASTTDSNGAWGAFSSYVTFNTHTTGVPISLSPTGGATVGSLTPALSGSRHSSSDWLTAMALEVYESDGTTLKWSSASSPAGVISAGFSRTYAGAALSYGTTYKWRAQVTSSIGGTSAWSALQTFATPSGSTPTQTAPVGSPITTLTPTFTGAWTDTLKGIQIIVYTDAAGTSVHWDQGQVAHGVGTSYSYVYAGTALAWNTQYWWKISVQKNADNVWQSFTGLTSFTTDSAGVPTLDAPSDNAWLGGPVVVDNFDNITGFTNGANLTAAAEGTTYQTGRGSVKFTGTFTGAQTAYRTVAKDLSAYGKQTPIKIRAYIDSLTSVSFLRLRFTFATATDYAEYTITPSGAAAWEQKTVTLGSPVATSGTVNWSNVTRIGLVCSYSSSVGRTIYLDDLIFDASAPSFDGTSYSAETITYFRIRVYSDAGGTSLIWDSGDTASSSTTFSIIYGGTTLTRSTTYYWQARYTKSTGPVGNYSALRPFSINGAPVAPSDMSPANGTVIADSLVPVFVSTFSDSDKTSKGDAPTMYEVEIYRNSDSVLAYRLLKDASLTGGSNSVASGDSGVLKVTGAANPIAYETEYKYQSRYRDYMGYTGAWSSYLIFKPSQSPATTVTGPSEGGTVSSPEFTASWSYSSAGAKAQNSYQIRLVRSSDAVLLYDSGRVYSSAASQIISAGYLINSTAYELYVRTWDSDALVSAYDVNAFTTSWSAPDQIANFTVTDDASLSAVVLSWEISNLSSTDFRQYTIYRKKSSESVWTTYATLTNQADVAYLDYLTSNTVGYDYYITQWKKVAGDVDLQSAASDLGTAVLDTDSWVVIGADRAADHIFELPVSAGPFVEPVQQEVFEPLGTTRKVIIRGKELGAEGLLTVRWMDAERAVALTQIAYLKSNNGPHILKSPFGDLWIVEFSGPSKDYLGGGHMNATLVWTEVE